MLARCETVQNGSLITLITILAGTQDSLHHLVLSPPPPSSIQPRRQVPSLYFPRPNLHCLHVHILTLPEAAECGEHLSLHCSRTSAVPGQSASQGQHELLFCCPSHRRSSRGAGSLRLRNLCKANCQPAYGMCWVRVLEYQDAGNASATGHYCTLQMLYRSKPHLIKKPLTSSKLTTTHPHHALLSSHIQDFNKYYRSHSSHAQFRLTPLSPPFPSQTPCSRL